MLIKRAAPAAIKFASSAFLVVMCAVLLVPYAIWIFTKRMITMIFDVAGAGLLILTAVVVSALYGIIALLAIMFLSGR